MIEVIFKKRSVAMSTPIEILGVPEKKIKAYTKKGFKTTFDLINHLPRKYDDLTQLKLIKEVMNKEFCGVIGTVVGSKEGPRHVTFTCKDQTGETFWVHIFGIKREAYRQCSIGRTYLFGGKWSANEVDNKIYVSIASPPYVEGDIQNATRIHSIYKKVHKDIPHEDFKDHLNVALNFNDTEDFLEPELFYNWTRIDTSRLDHPLVIRQKAYRGIHHPRSMHEIEESEYRISFDKLFYLSYLLHKRMPLEKKEIEGITLSRLDLARYCIKNLPFKLTSGQHEVLKDMMARIQTGKQLSALVQGDVGSGKTLVAIIMMLCHVENGYQSILMAPTSVLAKQHAQEIEKMLTPFGLKTVFISGNLKKKEKDEIYKQIENGEVHFIVGTHAVLNDGIKFKNLGVMIVDEEHRFGVNQREAVRERTRKEPLNFISMTATPIPRTLAASLYDSNIQTYSIKSLPQGRKPIQTTWITQAEGIVDHLLYEISNGRQGYIICPLIKHNKKLDNVMAIDTCEKWIKSHPKMKNLRYGVVTGEMEPKLMEERIQAFKNHEFDVLLSTTVIEVGVNVPNSTIICIQSADRFGLAQLHQLRGRVGRGSHASYCYLISDNPTPNGQKKLSAMVESTDGFYLSEADLKLRGAGDLVGDSQTGFETTFLLLLKYPSLFEKIQEEMNLIFADENRLNHYGRFFDGK